MRIISYAVTLLMLAATSPLRAVEVTVGNFRYDVVEFYGSDEKEAMVIGFADGYEPSGQLAFPATIKYEGKNVKVKGLGWSNHVGHEGDTPVIGGLDAVTSVKIPKYMDYIGKIEFKNCRNIEKYEVEEGSEFYTVVDGALVELETYSGELRRILVRYPSAKTATNYVVPSTIGSIEFGAFAANEHLKKIYLIGDQMLRTCWQYNNRSIETVDCSYSTNYRTDSDGALSYGAMFIGVPPGRVYGQYRVPEARAYIASGAFCNAQAEEVVIPAKFKDDGAEEYMFLESTVRKVTYEGSAPNFIWPCAFMGCGNLETIDLGANDSGVLKIYTCAFKDCVSLKSVTFAEGTKNIEMSSRVFEGCRSLSDFPLTSSMRIKSLGNREFYGCESLTSFPFSCVREFDTLVGYVFAGSGLQTVHWPSGSKSMPRGCFADCKQLTKVYLKDTTVDIYEAAFARSGLVALNMMGVKWWSRSAFENCPGLIRLYFPDNGVAVNYHTVDFITEEPQIVVNNPKICYLEEQAECPGVASLYISMVDGGPRVGDGWKHIYVPGGAGDLYSQLTVNPVDEMYSFESIPSEGAVRIVPLVTGVKIVSVEIDGEEASYSGGVFTIGRPVNDGAGMSVTVNYTVFGNTMTSRYIGVYSGVESVGADAAAEPAEWFTLDGIRINREDAAPGVYIRRTAQGAEKVIVK